MTVVCPICKTSAQEFSRTRDATGFHCPTHGDFKVADAVFAEAKAKAKDYTHQQWEVALKKAQLRTKQGEWPIVRIRDFNR